MARPLRIEYPGTAYHVMARERSVGAKIGDRRKRIIEVTTGNTLIGPGSIPWEIGNAFSAMFKQKRLTLTEAEKRLSIFKGIPIRYIDPDFVKALKFSKQANIYAYDAYFLDCAIRYKAPLLTLDRKLIASALNFNVETLEV